VEPKKGIEPLTFSLRGGTSVVELRVAVDRRDDEADFLTVKAFGNMADAQAEHLAKGRYIAVTGRLQQERWETADGQKREMVVIVAREIDWLDHPATDED
jgi:single-strand DNA-binding protein